MMPPNRVLCKERMSLQIHSSMRSVPLHHLHSKGFIPWNKIDNSSLSGNRSKYTKGSTSNENQLFVLTIARDTKSPLKVMLPECQAQISSCIYVNICNVRGRDELNYTICSPYNPTRSISKLSLLAPNEALLHLNSMVVESFSHSFNIRASLIELQTCPHCSSRQIPRSTENLRVVELSVRVNAQRRWNICTFRVEVTYNDDMVSCCASLCSTPVSSYYCKRIRPCTTD